MSYDLMALAINWCDKSLSLSGIDKLLVLIMFYLYND